MRKFLLISLAAVIVAGGLAITTYGQDKPEREGPPRFERRPEGRPGGEGQRRGPPRSQLNEKQRADLAELMKGEVAARLMKALANFQEAVTKIVGDDERAVRMAVFQVIMRQMRPQGAGDRERGDRDRRDRRPRGEGDRPPRGEGKGPGDRPK